MTEQEPFDQEPQESVLSPEEKFSIVESSPKVVHLTGIEDLESALEIGIVGQETAERSGLNIRYTNPISQKAAKEKNAISVYDEKASSLASLEWSQQDHAMHLQHSMNTFFLPGIRVALFLNPEISRRPLDEKENYFAQEGESFIGRRVKAREILLVGLHQSLAQQQIESLTRGLSSSAMLAVNVAARLANSPHLSDEERAELNYLTTGGEDKKKAAENAIFYGAEALPQILKALKDKYPDLYQIYSDHLEHRLVWNRYVALVGEYNRMKKEKGLPDMKEPEELEEVAKEIDELDERRKNERKGIVADAKQSKQRLIEALEQLGYPDQELIEGLKMEGRLISTLPRLIEKHVQKVTGKSSSEITVFDYVEDVAKSRNVGVVVYDRGGIFEDPRLKDILYDR